MPARQRLRLWSGAGALRALGTLDGTLSSTNRGDGAPASSESYELGEASSRDSPTRSRSFSAPRHAAGPTGRRASESSVFALRQLYEAQGVGFRS